MFSHYSSFVSVLKGTFQPLPICWSQRHLISQRFASNWWILWMLWVLEKYVNFERKATDSNPLLFGRSGWEQWCQVRLDHSVTTWAIRQVMETSFSGWQEADAFSKHKKKSWPWPETISTLGGLNSFNCKSRQNAKTSHCPTLSLHTGRATTTAPLTGNLHHLAFDDFPNLKFPRI